MRKEDEAGMNVHNGCVRCCFASKGMRRERRSTWKHVMVRGVMCAATSNWFQGMGFRHIPKLLELVAKIWCAGPVRLGRTAWSNGFFSSHSFSCVHDHQV